MKVRIVLGGIVRLEYSTVVEVPDNSTPAELQDLVEKYYDEVDGGEYEHDPSFWERGECYWQEVREDAKP